MSLFTIFSSAFGGSAAAAGTGTAAAASKAGLLSGGASALSLLSSFSSLASGGLQMYTAGQKARFEQQRLLMNSQWQEIQAKQIELNAQERANNIRDQLLSDMASTSAFFAARGVDIGSGSPARANIESQRRAAEDMIQNNRQARLNATAQRSSAGQTKTNAAIARSQGTIEQAKALPGMLKSGAQLYTGLRSLLNG